MSAPQRDAIERREAAVAELVSVVMQTSPGHRYATAYGTLSALVTSEDLDPLSYARSFVRQLEDAMSTGLTGVYADNARRIGELTVDEHAGSYRASDPCDMCEGTVSVHEEGCRLAR